MIFQRSTLRLAAVTVVALALAASPPRTAARQSSLTLNEQGFFQARGLDVLVFQNWYSGDFSDSKLSGIELIHHGVRIATNGDVRLSSTPEQWDPTPEFGGKHVDTASARVDADLSYPKYAFTYRISASAQGDGVLVRVSLPAPLPRELDGRAGFNLEFLPSAFFGKTYALDTQTGVCPRYAGGPMAVDRFGSLEAVPLASGTRLVLAPEDPERRVTIDARGATVSLYDGRNKAQNGWFVVRSLLPAGKAGVVLEWLVTPNRVPDWTRPVVIAHSQAGYHPDEKKIAVLESDPNGMAPASARLLKLDAGGSFVERLQGPVQPWGRYLRYQYGRFDFSAATEPGVYAIEAAGIRTPPFRIARDVYANGIWQPSLDTFLAEQMDHVLVNDRYRVWHGASHLDDARQAPAPHPHFDLYAQGPTTDSPFKAGEHIPGLNMGGWFDAGDFDLRTQTHYAVVSQLVDAYETFRIDHDQTTVQEQNRFVDIGRPDGVADVLQQIEHGTLFLIAQHRVFGHAIPGIVEPVLEQYTHLGDAVTKTDGLIYAPALEGKPPAGGESGVPDDRWAFTTHTTPLNYGSAAALAAASRVLRGRNAALADECLKTAVKVWDEEHGREPALFRSGNTTGGRLEDEELAATVELLMTTKGDRKYADRLDALWPYVDKNFGTVGALAARALPFMDANYRARMTDAVKAYKAATDEQMAKNPFGVPITTGGWAGSGAVLGFGIRMYILHKAFPDIIGPEYTFRAIQFMLGTHPASSVSLVSGVGTHTKTIAYGNNRADFTAIPGGIVPGVLMVKPDLPELQEDWPFLWYENEYVINVAAMFVYLGNAAHELMH